MKILHFLNHLHGGGAEMMLCNLLEAPRPSAVQHIVVSLAKQSDHPTAKRIMQAADAHYCLGQGGFLHPKALLGFWRILRSEKPDIVQSWLHKPDLVGGILGKLAGSKPVWGIHSMDVTQEGNQGNARANLFRKALAWVSRWAPAAVVTCSHAAQKRHVSWGYPNAKFCYIPNGIDTRRFVPNADARAALRAQLSIPESAPVIGFVGRLAPVKNVPLFVEAAAIFQKNHPEAHFILCGDAPSPELEIKPNTVRNLHRLAFRTEVEQVYPAFDVLALTSVSEAYPMVLLEAMACGVPCASTDVGDAATMLANVGKVTPSNDAAAMAGSWEALIQSGHCTPNADYSLERCSKAYGELYTRLVTA